MDKIKNLSKNKSLLPKTIIINNNNKSTILQWSCYLGLLTPDIVSMI